MKRLTTIFVLLILFATAARSTAPTPAPVLNLQTGSVFRLPPWNHLILSDHSVPHWEVTDAWFGDSSGQYEPSDGSTNTRVIAFREGRPAISVTAYLFSPSFNIPQTTSLDSVSGNAMSTFVLGPGENFDPNRGERGYDSVRMEGVSDVIDGIGLPLKQHVQTWVIFDYKQGNGAPTPTLMPIVTRTSIPSRTSTPVPRQTATPTPVPGGLTEDDVIRIIQTQVPKYRLVYP